MYNVDDFESDTEEPTHKSFFGAVKNIIKEMFDLKLLFQNMDFFFITLSNFFCFSALFIPFIFIPVRAEELEIKNFAWLLSIIGIK